MATFEDQLAELERVVDRLESGGLPLEESVQLFESGMRLSQACKVQLSAAESRIRVLIDPQDHGPIRTEDLAVDVDEDEEELDDESEPEE